LLSSALAQWIEIEQAGVSLYNDPKAVIFTGDETTSFAYLTEGWVDVAGKQSPEIA